MVRFFNYNNGWYSVGACLLIGRRIWEISFIGTDGCALLKKGNKTKVITGNVNVFSW